ncbi:MAG: SIR2 family protein [Staphylococcus sp.]|nr:SIR2 family protein [Staphylococcus sp.]
MGAGVSANSGVPVWGELIHGLKKELPDSLKYETDDLKIAQLYKDSRGYKEYIEKIKEQLLYGKIAPNPIHDAILELTPCHIVTTNYDDLIEQSMEQKFMQYHIIRKDEDLPYTQYQNMLIKMHGDFNIGNIVLTENDYYNYPNNFPLINAFVKSLFASKLILFIGFSFNDMNLKILLNSVGNILKENMQRVYLLTNKNIDSIQKKYYEKKGINIIELTSEFVDETIKQQSINVDDGGIASIYGKKLYRQLVLIKHYRQESDLIDYLYERIKSYVDEIKVLGNGLKYIFPENEISFWNYHSTGLQICSPYVKKLTKQLQTYTGRREFVNKYNDKILELRKQAYLNRIFKIDNLSIVNKTFYRKLKKLFPVTRGVELFYELDYINLSNYLKRVRHQVKKYNIEDLEFPYLLYKLGDYYQSYLIYKDLANETWKKKRYILYFICMYNIHAIRYGIQIQLMSRNDIDYEKIIKDIEKIDLRDVLIKLPIDKSIKHVLEDLLSYRFHSVNLVESDILKEDLSGQRISAEKGGFSSNRKVFLLEHKSYQEFDFSNDNYIICDNNNYSEDIYYNVVSGILISNVTKSNGSNLFSQTKIDELGKEHLVILVFHIKNKNLLKIYKHYNIKSIILSDEGCSFINIIIKNTKESIGNSNCMNYLIIDRNSFCNIMQNVICIINKTNCKNINCSDLYPIINYIWSNIYLIEFGKELTELIHKCKPEIKDAIALVNNIISIHDDDSLNDALFLLCDYLSSQNQIIDNIKTLNDIKVNNDYFYLASLYPALSANLKEEAVLWFRENIKGLYYAASIHLNYGIPVLDVKTLSELIKNPFKGVSKYVRVEETVCAVLARIRKDTEQQELHPILDKLSVKNECFKFFIDPLHFENKQIIESTWLCYCEDNILKQLLKDEVLRNKMKIYIKEDYLGKLEYERIWKIL